jgi:hypothetical protein
VGVEASGGLVLVEAVGRQSTRRALLAFVFMVAWLCLFLPTGPAIASPPANDDFENAVTLQEGQLTVLADTVEATKQTGEPNHRGDPGGASVWFKWTAPRSGGVFLQACDAGNKFLVAAYTGDAVNSLVEAPPIEAWRSCQYTFFAIAGTTYRIAVDGKYDPVSGEPATGNPGLWLQMVPPNDDSRRPRISGAGANLRRLAGAQSGRPSNSGSPNTRVIEEVLRFGLPGRRRCRDQSRSMSALRLSIRS